MSVLNMGQLSELTGKTYRTLHVRLEGIPPAREDGKSKWWESRQALAAIYDAGPSDPQQERARLDRLRGDKITLDLERERGEVVNVHEVALSWTRIVTDAKSRLLGVPTKAAPLVMGCKRVEQAKAVMEDQILDALGDLADSLAGGFGGGETPAETDGEPVGGRSPEAEPGVERRTG